MGIQLVNSTGINRNFFVINAKLKKNNNNNLILTYIAQTEYRHEHMRITHKYIVLYLPFCFVVI